MSDRQTQTRVITRAFPFIFLIGLLVYLTYTPQAEPEVFNSSALMLYRTYPRIPFWEQIHENKPFFNDTGRLNSYCDIPEATEYGENFVVGIDVELMIGAPRRCRGRVP